MDYNESLTEQYIIDEEVGKQLQFHYRIPIDRRMSQLPTTARVQQNNSKPNYAQLKDQINLKTISSPTIPASNVTTVNRATPKLFTEQPKLSKIKLTGTNIVQHQITQADICEISSSTEDLEILSDFAQIS